MNTPASGRLLCIGDIHGCAREFECLIDALAPGADDRLVLLGDYVDRGPDSAGVLRQVLALRDRLPHLVTLRGNHEEMLLSWLGWGGSRGDHFLRAGGRATLSSFGLSAGEASPEDLAAALPEAERSFLSAGLVDLWAEDGFLFVHAGVRPGIVAAQQSREDLCWIREDFLSVPEHGLDEIVVFGHTARPEVWWPAERRVLGLDSGCVYGGWLSAIDFTRAELVQVRSSTLEVQRCCIEEGLAALRSRVLRA